ncbi:MAG: type II toxin-antitoxin system VapC family toxin [Actinomycetota bacterium]
MLDTGVTYAALDRRDRAHKPCRTLIEEAQETLIIPAATLPEVDYWTAKHLGPGALIALLRDVIDGAFVVVDLDAEDYTRVAEILDRYADQNIGFVDAAVFATVERLGEPKLATLDRRHFRVLRPRHVDALKLLPG